MYNRNLEFSSYYRGLKEKVRGEILRESEEQIIGTNIEEFTKYFYDKYALSPIKEDQKRVVTWDIKNYLATIPAHERESFHIQQGDLYNFPCQKIIIEIPILPNKHIDKIARFETSNYSISYSDRDFNWNLDKITASIEIKGYGFKYEEDKIAREVEYAHERINETIKRKNSDIENGNHELWVYIKQVISDSKQRIIQNKEKIKSLTKKINIPIKIDLIIFKISI